MKSFLWITFLVPFLNACAAIPLSDPFEIVYTQYDQTPNAKIEDLQFTGKKDYPTRFKKQELNRTLYRSHYFRDYDEYLKLDPYFDTLGDEWINPYAEFDALKKKPEENKISQIPASNPDESNENSDENAEEGYVNDNEDDSVDL